MRVTQAVILISRPWKRILGLSPLERTLLAASLAGVKDFILIGDTDAEEAEILSPLLKDKRFRDRAIRPDFVPLTRLAELGRTGRIRSRFWLMEDRLVCAPDILEKAALAEPAPARDVLVVNGAGGGGSDGPFSGVGLS